MSARVFTFLHCACTIIALLEGRINVEGREAGTKDGKINHRKGICYHRQHHVTNSESLYINFYDSRPGGPSKKFRQMGAGGREEGNGKTLEASIIKQGFFFYRIFSSAISFFSSFFLRYKGKSLLELWGTTFFPH